jgi:hypothetical protein
MGMVGSHKRATSSHTPSDYKSSGGMPQGDAIRTRSSMLGAKQGQDPMFRNKGYHPYKRYRDRTIAILEELNGGWKDRLGS